MLPQVVPETLQAGKTTLRRSDWDPAYEQLRSQYAKQLSVSPTPLIRQQLTTIKACKDLLQQLSKSPFGRNFSRLWWRNVFVDDCCIGRNDHESAQDSLELTMLNDQIPETACLWAAMIFGTQL